MTRSSWEAFKDEFPRQFRTLQQVESLFRECDSEDVGAITLKQFTFFVRRRISEDVLSSQAISFAFMVADTDADGFLTFGDVVRLWQGDITMNECAAVDSTEAEGNTNSTSSYPDTQSEPFSVEIVTMSGSTFEIANLDSTQTLDSLLAQLFQKLAADRSRQITLCSGSRRFAPHEARQTLASLGITNGAQLVCVFSSVLFGLRQGMQVKVSGAGSEVFNGVYVGYTERGKCTLYKKANSHIKINWVQKTSASWPSGWYFQAGMRGAYFEASCLVDCLPLVGWDVYSGALSKAGRHPAPTIELLCSLS